MSDKKQSVKAQAQESKVQPLAGGELTDEQLQQAAGGLDVMAAVEKVIIGGALGPKKK